MVKRVNAEQQSVYFCCFWRRRTKVCRSHPSWSGFFPLGCLSKAPIARAPLRCAPPTGRERGVLYRLLTLSLWDRSVPAVSTACPAAGGGILRSHVGPGLPGRVCRWPASSSETEPSSGDPPHCPPVDIVDPCFVPVWWVWNGAIVVLVCALTAAAEGAPTCVHARPHCLVTPFAWRGSGLVARLPPVARRTFTHARVSAFPSGRRRSVGVPGPRTSRPGSPDDPWASRQP